MKKSIQLGIASVALVAALAGCGSKGSKPVATVNGEPISFEDFYFTLTRKPTVRVMTNQGPVDARVAERLDFQALQESILRRITLQLAADEGVLPTDEDVRKEIEFRKSLNPNYVAQMQANGYDLAHIKQIVKLELARERLLTKGITVTKADAEKYIKENPNQFKEPATIDLRWILLPPQETKALEDKAKARIKKELDSGRPFAEVARVESAFRDNENRYPIRVEAQLPPDVRKAIAKVTVGQHSDWVFTPNGWAIFEVLGRQKERDLPMNPARIEGVRRSLALQQGQKTNDLADRIIKKLKASKDAIKVEDKDLKDLWQKSFDDFLKTQKEAGTKPEGQPGATPK